MVVAITVSTLVTFLLGFTKEERHECRGGTARRVRHILGLWPLRCATVALLYWPHYLREEKPI